MTEKNPPVSRAYLYLVRVDTWTAAKTGAWLGLATGIGVFTTLALTWWLTSTLRLITTVEDTFNELLGSTVFTLTISEVVTTSRILQTAAIAAGIAAALTLILVTVTAALYNAGVKVFGGIHLTLSDAPTGKDRTGHTPNTSPRLRQKAPGFVRGEEPTTQTKQS